MLKTLTQGTASASIIFLATVVFPEALPPHKPGRMKKNIIKL